MLSAVYTYDAGGRRVRSWDTVSGTTDYVYSGLNIIDEVSGGVHERHFYAGGMHIASNTSGTVEYYHVDHLGSTRLKTASDGSEVYDSNYEPFGVGVGETGSDDYRYTGKHEDPSGLYYFGARYYDPLTGRFTTRDTVMGRLTDPQSQNRYVYCMNNPHKYVDPDGKEPTLGTAILIGGTLGSLTRLTQYAIDCAITGKIPTARGVAKAGITGFLSGGTTGASVIAHTFSGPAGSAAVKVIGNSLEYVANQVIDGEEVTLEGVGVTVATSLVSTGVTQMAGISLLTKYASDENVVTAIKTTLINPNVSAVKKSVIKFGHDLFTDPKTYEHYIPIDSYEVTHGHDPWVYGR